MFGNIRPFQFAQWAEVDISTILLNIDGFFGIEASDRFQHFHHALPAIGHGEIETIQSGTRCMSKSFPFFRPKLFVTRWMKRLLDKFGLVNLQNNCFWWDHSVVPEFQAVAKLNTHRFLMDADLRTPEVLLAHEVGPIIPHASVDGNSPVRLTDFQQSSLQMVFFFEKTLRNCHIMALWRWLFLRRVCQRHRDETRMVRCSKLQCLLTMDWNDLRAGEMNDR